VHLHVVIVAMVYNSHGVIDDSLYGLFEYKSHAKLSDFMRYLSLRTHKFVPLDNALSGHGDALTIDDATGAAYHEATLARTYGHSVALFINSGYVEESCPYFFALLDSALVQATARIVEFQNRIFNISVIKERSTLRAEVKRIYRSLALETERKQLIKDILNMISCPNPFIGPSLHTLSLMELAQLQAIGVSVENHGWSHGEVGAMPFATACDEVLRSREWLRRNLNISSSLYAVPFGEALREDVAIVTDSDWLLASRARGSGRISSNVYNRANFTEDPEWVALQRGL
jgi:peptidoglycan/xylan/chitin deacetylase (PgdA/CDA1 family)